MGKYSIILVFVHSQSKNLVLAIMNPNFFPGEIALKKTSLENNLRYKELCLVCFYRGLLSFVFGCIGVKSRCRHKTKNFFGPSEFYLSSIINKITTFSIISAITIEIIFWINILRSSQHTGAYFLVEMQDFIVTAGIELTLISVVLNLSWKPKLNNLMIGVLSNAKFYELTIPPDDMREIHWAKGFCTYGLCPLVVGTVILQVTCTPFHTYLEIFSTPTGHIIQYFLVMIINMEITILNKIFQSMRLSLSEQMKKGILDPSAYHQGKDKKYPLNLDEKLKRTLHGYVELKGITDTLSILMNPTGLILVLVTIFQLISEIYIIINFKLYDFKKDQDLFITLIVTTLPEFYIIGIFVGNIENLITEVSIIIQIVH